MRPSRQVLVTVSVLLIVCLGASAVLVHAVDGLRPVGSLEEVLYLSSSKALRRMSLGYTGLVADIYWTRAVQYFGGKHHAGAMRYDLLAPLLDITTDLDPQLLVAYEFGGTFLAQRPPGGAGVPDKAVALVEKGIRANPNEWRLYYALGFIHYMERKDYTAAAAAFLEGSKVPNAHPWMKFLAAQMARRGGDLETARMMWTATYDTTQDNMIRQNAAEHLRALQAESDINELERIVELYRTKNGHPPASFRELIDAGMLLSIPRDPVGYPYLLKPGGEIEVRSPEKLPFLQKGLPQGYTPSTSTALESK
jgi:tetratricopeptide (TPR) repeat protein